MLQRHSFSRVNEGERLMMCTFNVVDHCSGVDLDYLVVNSKEK